MESTFLQMAATLAVAAAVGTLAIVLRQPLIVAFIAVGILVGPAVFGWVTPGSELELLASLGIGILLFLVGLKLDPQMVRATGPVALATGLGQIGFTALAGYAIAVSLGFDMVPALYIAIALTFSSTIIIVKLLSDKRELDDLHGRIAVGIIIVQDIVVVLALIVVTSLSGNDASSIGGQVAMAALKGVGLLLGLLAMMRWVLPWIVGKAARNKELLVLFATAWAIGMAGVSELLDFSVEVGAFLAGIALASTPYREAIASRLVSLRDFLLLFFFIDLGAKLQLDQIGAQWLGALVLSVFVLFGKPLLIMVIMGAMRYRKRTSFLTGATLGQISEFSLIFVALGARVGHVDDSVLGVVTMIGLITIGLSTYVIHNSKEIYELLAPRLSIFERDSPRAREPDDEGSQQAFEAVIFGGGRHGTRVAKGLEKAGHSVLIVDMDPDAIEACNKMGIKSVYGDAEDPEFLLSLPLDETRWVISTVRDADIHLALAHGLRTAGYAGDIAFTAHDQAEANRLEKEGVGLVIAPFVVAAERLVDTLLSSVDTDDGKGSSSKSSGSGDEIE